MSGFIAWILLGLLAGGLAKLLMPGDQKGGCLMTIVLGVVGALIGGWLGKLTGFLPDKNPGDWLPAPGSILTATVGAFVLLLVFRLLGKK
jgi:uncharacterized membrane protein YeaQ/YmgE (transglycosylase-associated protein family)